MAVQVEDKLPRKTTRLNSADLKRDPSNGPNTVYEWRHQTSIIRIVLEALELSPDQISS